MDRYRKDKISAWRGKRFFQQWKIIGLIYQKSEMKNIAILV